MMRYLLFTFVVVLAFSINSCARPIVTAPNSPVTLFKKLPGQYKIVHINGRRYYYFNGRHYKKTHRGYMVVKV